MRGSWKVKYLSLCMAVLLVLGLGGCGTNHKSPEGVVKELITAYGKGKEKTIYDCYGAEAEKADQQLKEEVQAMEKYLKAHGTKNIVLDDCEIIKDHKTYAYVYVTYGLELENGQEYPCIGTYLVMKKDKEYNVLTPSEITEDMSKTAREDYSGFMKTDTYKNYTKEYDTFIKKNPGYEEKISGKLNS